jgi:hypothetical protein
MCKQNNASQIRQKDSHKKQTPLHQDKRSLARRPGLIKAASQKLSC